MTQLICAACCIRCAPPHSLCRLWHAVNSIRTQPRTGTFPRRTRPDSLVLVAVLARWVGSFELEVSVVRWAGVLARNRTNQAWCGGRARSVTKQPRCGAFDMQALATRFSRGARRARLSCEAGRAGLVREELVTRCIRGAFAVQERFRSGAFAVQKRRRSGAPAVGACMTRAWYGSFASRVAVGSVMAHRPARLRTAHLIRLVVAASLIRNCFRGEQGRLGTVPQ